MTSRVDESQSDYAFVVGINHYDHEELTDLEGAVNDAEAFATWLHKGSGSFPDGPGDEFPFLLRVSGAPGPSPADGARKVGTNRADLEGALNQLVRLAVDRSDKGHGQRLGRRLYMFLAGHGVEATAGGSAQTTLLCSDATKWVLTHLPLRDTAEQAREMFDEVVLLADCCRIPRPHLDRLSTLPWTIPRRPEAVPHKYLRGFATQRDREARECDSPQGRKLGIFTQAVLAGLRGRAADDNGRVTAHRLVEFVRAHLGEFIPVEQRQREAAIAEQVPDFDLSEGDGEFTLCTISVADAGAQLPVEILLGEEHRGEELIVEDGALRVMYRGAVAALPELRWSSRLPAGRLYWARLHPCGLDRAIRLAGDRGQRVDFRERA
jgi:hypothetical protein